MPRDKRLYMTFAIDFWQHPKISPLSDAGFRTFVEMNGYSRMQDLDGRIPMSMAHKLWRRKAVNELLQNHPERPSLYIDGDDYVLWNYEEHQFTRADRDALAEKNRTNGVKGGRPRKNPDETDEKPTGFQNGTQTNPGSESGLGTEDQDTYTSSHLSLLPSYPQTTNEPEVNIQKVKVAVQKYCGRDCPDTTAYLIVGTVLDRTKQTPKNKTAFVVRAIEADPFEWQQMIDEGAA